MKPFLTGRTQITSPSLQPVLPAPANELGARVVGHKHMPSKGNTSAGFGPTIECVKQGDKIARIVVTCPCGERIEIECIYPAGG